MTSPGQLQITSPIRNSRAAPRTALLATLGVASFLTAGCQNPSLFNAITGQNSASITGQSTAANSVSPSAKSEAEWRREADTLAPRYRADPHSPATAIAYAQALRGGGQRVQAVSVLEQASLQHPQDSALLGAYGRALADVGKFDQALEVLGRAHTPDQPDWRILSVEGAVLDELGRHQEAQRYYASALKIKPDDPSVLSNLGLSYALAKDLKNAESTLRRAVVYPGADPRVRQNLALVVGLQGRRAEAETIARADLPSEQAAANVASLRQILAHQDDKDTGSPAAQLPPRRT